MPGGTSNEVSGVVHGPSIQARQIRGDVHIHQPPLPPLGPLPPPFQLPPPGLLLGRDADLQAMDAAQGSRLIVVCGPPGVGKSALVVSWAHGVRAGFPDGVLLADLRGHAPDAAAAPGEALERFLRALGVDTRYVSGDLAELTGLYRSVMIDRRMLVVLDDARSAAQVSPLLSPSPHSAAVVTSRTRLAALAAIGARVIQVGRIGDDAAVELLTRIIGDDRARTEPQAARHLVELCAGLPLAVCVASARLAARPRWPVSEMGRAHAHAGNPEAAAGYLGQALRAMREIGSARGEADALTALGDLAHRAGRQDESRTRYTQAQLILSVTGSAGQLRIAERLARLDQPPALNRTTTST